MLRGRSRRRRRRLGSCGRWRWWRLMRRRWRRCRRARRCRRRRRRCRRMRRCDRGRRRGGTRGSGRRLYCRWRRRLGSGRRLGLSLRRRLRFSIGPDLALRLSLRDHGRRGLRLRRGACELHRGEGRRGEQHEAKLGHDDEILGKVLEVSVAINRYALGRNVAIGGEPAGFISASEAFQNINVHCAFRRTLRLADASSCGKSASVAGFGVSGPFGPRGGISSGT